MKSEPAVGVAVAVWQVRWVCQQSQQECGPSEQMLCLPEWRYENSRNRVLCQDLEVSPLRDLLDVDLSNVSTITIEHGLHDCEWECVTVSLG